MIKPENELDMSEDQLIKRINELERENAELKSTSDRLNDIISLVPGNIWWKDRKGRFLGCNNNTAHILGYPSSADIIGKKQSEIFDTIYTELAEQRDLEVYNSASEKYTEEMGNDINKQPAIYLVKKRPFFDNVGNVAGLVGVSFDITERKKMEESLKIAKEKAVASSQSKSQFLAVVNHELRTPLSSIMGLVNFLKRGNLPADEEGEVINALENCAQHLLNLVNDMLDFSKLETNRYHKNIKPVNLTTLVHEVYSIVSPLAENKKLQLIIEIEPDVPSEIMSDARVLRQILINLLGNAIKFTERGHVVLQIKKFLIQGNHAQLEITVIDTGIGIPEDKIKLIFEPFHQLEDAYTRQSSRRGTGLGLTIVKKLTSILGGSIHVSSEPGKGSSFSFIGSFELPNDKTGNLTNVTATAEEEHQNIVFDNQTITPTTPHQAKILLVEDDPIVQFVHKKMLMDLGCEVDVVSNGNDAITTLNDHDLMFVDISLPDISGFEVIKAVRALGLGSTVPIIALTVYTGKEEKEACMAAGASDFASKPISPATLQQLLTRYVKKKELFNQG